MTNCKCREKSKCPISGKCNTKCVVYKAKVTNTTYIGMIKGPFKAKFNNDAHSFWEEMKRNATTISQYV